MNIHWKEWCWSWSSNTLANLCQERLRSRGEGGGRGWDGSIASLTQWIWVWAYSGRYWRTGKPGVLQLMGLQSWTQLSNWTTTSPIIIELILLPILPSSCLFSSGDHYSVLYGFIFVCFFLFCLFVLFYIWVKS